MFQNCRKKPSINRLFFRRWPLVRDCTFYSISILVMLVVICNEVISWPEALFMMICYVGYCIALCFNQQLEKLVQPYILRLPIKLPTRDEQSSLVTFKNAPDSSYTQGIPTDGISSPQQELNEAKEPDTSIYDPKSSWDPNSAWDSGDAASAPAANTATSWNSGYDDWNSGSQNYGYTKSEAENGMGNEKPVGVETTTAMVSSNNEAEYYKPKEQRPELPDPLIKPESADLLTTIYWYVVYPIHFCCRWTVRQTMYIIYRR